MKLLLATRSAHKAAEIRRILSHLPGLRIVDLEAAGLAYDPEEESLEPYETFEANARSKAAYFRRKSGLPTVADDSGIEVDALGGAPGVRSKRFAPGDAEGEARDRANNEHLLERLADLELAERTARYVCVAALDEGKGRVHTFRGTSPEGLILGAPRGTGGFGYDPLFYDPELGKTFAQISPAEKNARSHRGRAFRALAEYLEERLEEEAGDGGEEGSHEAGEGSGAPTRGRRAEGGP